MTPERTSALHAETPFEAAWSGVRISPGPPFIPPPKRGNISEKSLKRRLKTTWTWCGRNELGPVQYSRSRQGKSGGTDGRHIRNSDDSSGSQPQCSCHFEYCNRLQTVVRGRDRHRSIVARYSRIRSQFLAVSCSLDKPP